jgi:hypothetical protein
MDVLGVTMSASPAVESAHATSAHTTSAHTTSAHTTSAHTTSAHVTSAPDNGPAHVATPTEDLITALLGCLIILGAAADGWAHNNILSEVQEDGFFTPWHGLLYSGFATTAGWTFWLAYRRRDRSPRWWVDGWPAGYRAGAVGVGVFLLAGLFDMVWHTVFGIEVTIDALLSPSHLMLCVGSVLLLTSPARSWWRAGDGGRRALAGMLALALGTTSVSVFLGYVSFFGYVDAVLPYDGAIDSAGFTAASRGVASYLVTSAMLVVPLVLAYRRRVAPGLATLLVAWVALFPMLTHEFPRPNAAGAFAAIAAAVVVDVLLVRLAAARTPSGRGMAARAWLPLAAALFAGAITSAHLLAVHLDAGVRWPAELWTGAVVTSVAVAAVLAGLANGPADRAAADR